MTLISRDDNICFTVSFGISCPISLFVFSKLKNTCLSLIFFGYSSIKSLEISPPAISVIRLAAYFNAYFVIFGSIPRSKRNEASVLSPCRFAVFLILTASKYADSINIFLVDSLTPESNPPNTPAKHIGESILHIIKSSGSKVRLIPSKVVNDSDFLAFLTITF